LVPHFLDQSYAPGWAPGPHPKSSPAASFVSHDSPTWRNSGRNFSLDNKKQTAETVVVGNKQEIYKKCAVGLCMLLMFYDIMDKRQIQRDVCVRQRRAWVLIHVYTGARHWRCDISCPSLATHTLVLKRSISCSFVTDLHVFESLETICNSSDFFIRRKSLTL